MPVYEYNCEEHGPFEAMRPMSECTSPCACPVCGAASQRVMLSAPNVSGLSTERRLAHVTNERASDSPKRLSTHGPGQRRAKMPSRKTVTGHDGSKCFPSSRPWMLSH